MTRGTLWSVVVGVIMMSGASGWAAEARLCWDPATGVELRTPVATIWWDRNTKQAWPVLKFAKGEVPLKNPQVVESDATRLKLAYKVAAPNGVTIALTRTLSLVTRGEETDVVEEFQLTPSASISETMEVIRPFAITGHKPAAGLTVVHPLFDGWARPSVLSNQPLCAAYQLGAVLPVRDRLVLPVVELGAAGAWRAALSADCRLSAQFNTATVDGKSIEGTINYSYKGETVPVKGTETRTFGLWMAPPAPAGEAFGASIDSFFRLQLPDVPPGPKWLHEIAMVYFDYLSENGAGWEKDLAELARMVKPEDRKHVAVCFHGWYETLGGYGYDDTTGKLKTEWVAMARTRKVSLTQDEVKRRLRVAKALGFRLLFYFADGLLQDEKAPFPGCYNPEWDWRDAQGKRKQGWQGPDTWGKTWARNPSHPEVVQWYSRYLKALLETYGPEVDGFVWDETFYIQVGVIGLKPEPAYCDRGMLDLMKLLRQQVKAVDPEKVLLASDCSEPGCANYAMMADGTWQDSWCKPDRWMYGLFPNWRNTLWSCNWYPITNFAWTRWGVENLGTPVSISNGYGDDKGPSEWTPEFKAQIMELFRARLVKQPTRFLTDSPAALLKGAPGRGERY